jgi:hypothetical protein
MAAVTVIHATSATNSNAASAAGASTATCTNIALYQKRKIKKVDSSYSV